MGLATASEARQSLQLGGMAMDLIRTHRTGAHPHQYETWYSAVSGQSPALCQELRRRLLAGAVTTQDLDELYGHYLAPKEPVEGTDRIGSTLLDQVDRFGVALHDAGAEGAVLDDTLSGTLDGLDDAGFAESDIERAAGQVLLATDQACRSNRELQARLKGLQSDLLAFREQFARAKAEAALDTLTGLCNRKSLEKQLDKALRDARGRDPSLCLVMADIDHFKQFNDEFGHLVGDQVIRLVGTVITQAIAQPNFAGRFGGEEFVIVLSRTPVADAVAIAEQIRGVLAAKELVRRSTRQKIAHVTISAGIAEFRRDDDASSLIERADRLLYGAKKAGRNRVFYEDVARERGDIRNGGSCDA